MMNRSITKYYIASFLSFLLAWFFRDAFYSLGVWLVLDEKIEFNHIEKLPNQLLSVVIYLIAIGIIPLLILFIKNFRRIISFKKLMSIGFIIITSGLLFLILRIFYLRFLVADLADQIRRAELALGGEFESVKLEDLHLEIFLFAGIILGSLFSLFIFRKKKIKLVK